jgi:hypothetical protein
MPSDEETPFDQPLDVPLINDLENAVAAVRATVDECHQVRETYLRAMEARPPGIGQWRVGSAPDCGLLESKLAQLEGDLARAMAGEPVPMGSAEATDLQDRADYAWQSELRDLDDLRQQTAKLAVQASDNQVKADGTAVVLAAAGAVTAVVGLPWILAEPPVGLSMEALAGVLEIGALACWALGSENQWIGNRYQDMNNALTEALRK